MHRAPRRYQAEGGERGGAAEVEGAVWCGRQRRAASRHHPRCGEAPDQESPQKWGGKRHAPGNSIGRPEVQAFVGSLVGFGASKGVFVTTASFSAQATDFVTRIPQRVILINGKRLTELMVEHGVGVRTSQTVEFKRLDEDFFSEE